MKLGVLTNVIGDTHLKEALAYFKSLGAQMVEIGCRSEERRVGKECRSRWSPYH